MNDNPENKTNPSGSGADASLPERTGGESGTQQKGTVPIEIALPESAERAAPLASLPILEPIFSEDRRSGTRAIGSYLIALATEQHAEIGKLQRALDESRDAKEQLRVDLANARSGYSLSVFGGIVLALGIGVPGSALDWLRYTLIVVGTAMMGYAWWQGTRK